MQENDNVSDQDEVAGEPEAIRVDDALQLETEQSESEVTPLPAETEPTTEIPTAVADSNAGASSVQQPLLSEHVQVSSRKRWMIAGGIAALVVVLLVAAVWWMLRTG